MIKPKLSRDATMFFNVEATNEGGTQPATLGSAYDSFKQAPDDVLLNWCGYNVKKYLRQHTVMLQFQKELGVELRRLIRKYGKKTLLWHIL